MIKIDYLHINCSLQILQKHISWSLIEISLTTFSYRSSTTIPMHTCALLFLELCEKPCCFPISFRESNLLPFNKALLLLLSSCPIIDLHGCLFFLRIQLDCSKININYIYMKKVHHQRILYCFS